jgi:hypothetical protein
MKRIILLAVYCTMISGVAGAQDVASANAGSTIPDSAGAHVQGAKKGAIKLYPNPSYGKISVSANTSTVLHFYVFDLEGTLVYQAVLNNKDRKNIENLKKGTYIYDVFEKDLSIEEGKIIIK